MHEPGGGVSGPADTVAARLRDAAPYLHLHRNAIFVLQVDIAGAACREPGALVQDLALLHSLGVRLVLVYGVEAPLPAGQETGAADAAGGACITGRERLERVLEDASRARISLEAGFSMGLPNTPMAGAALHACSGNFVHACPVGVRDGVDHGYIGRVRRVDTARLRARLDEGSIVLIPPVGYSLTGEVFHLSAVETAAAVAVALQAAKLLYLVRGGLRAPDGRAVRELDLEQAGQLLAGCPDPSGDAGVWRLQHGVDACRQGVQRVHIVDRDRDDALLTELYSRDGAAAMLSAACFDELRPAVPGDAGGILELVRPLQEEGLLTRRSLEQLERRLHRYTVMVRDGTVIACGALRVYAEQGAAEIECLAVHPGYRDRDRGRLLCAALEQRAERAGAACIYALTTGAAHWFLERGFTACSIAELPAPRRAEYDPARSPRALIKRLERRAPGARGAAP